jgi:hypothetical protein
VPLTGSDGSVIVDIKPCAICGKDVTANDYRNNAALALKGQGTTTAHLWHFFDESGATLENYMLNLEKLAVAFGVEEGRLMEGKG